MRQPSFPFELPEGITFPEIDPRLVPAPDDADEPLIEFAAVPRLRNRRNGWTEARQRAFIAALARCGSVAAAARVVGMTSRSAYRLIDAPGADQFAAAWDAAVDIGLARLQMDSLERSLKGDYVPIYRRGKLVRVEHRRNDRLAIAMLSGRNHGIEDYRRMAVSRREHRADLGKLDAARAAREDAIVEAENIYEQEVARLIETVVDTCAARAKGEPGVRQL